MQQHMNQCEQEVDIMKEAFRPAEKERDCANLNEQLKERKNLTEEAHMRVSKKDDLELNTELCSLKESLSNTREELEVSKKNIDSLIMLGLEKEKESELKAQGRDPSLGELKEEMDHHSEDLMTALLSNSNKRIKKLGAELAKRKESEANLLDSFVAQTRQLEQMKILHEESKLEIASLKKSLEKGKGNDGIPHHSQKNNNLLAKENFDSLKKELLLAKENLADAQEGEKQASLKVQSLMEEITHLKNELMLANEAEENSKKAMDDLALALKEVATEATQAKEKLNLVQVELEQTREEAECLKVTLKSNEEMTKRLLDEARKEADRYKNTSERLRLEAEESLSTWGGKESGFIDCIKEAEREMSIAQEETSRVQELLIEAENMNKKSKEENQKLRDILKQAINEANVAKEAAGIARAENSQLKDSLAEKEEALSFLTQENENLKIHEAETSENMKELKKLLSNIPLNESKEDKEKPKEGPNKKSMEKPKNVIGVDDKPQNEKGVELKPQNERGAKLETQNEKGVNKDPQNEIDGALRDYEHDKVISSPDSASPGAEEMGDLDETRYLEEMEMMEKNSRKKKALLRRFGDLWKKKNVPRKESAIEAQ